jgi:hypothetical protein
MVSLRSRRLEASFGAPLSEVTAPHVLELVRGAVQEDFDLDFKAQMYGNGDAERRDLAADVAAMANSAGGVIVLGVEENEHAQAVAAPGIAISDEVERRVLQVTAGISPAPPVAVRRLPLEATDSGHGFLLIIVPRSLSAPHAVVVNTTSLRYPVRHGTTTRYLTAPEVAAAYRQRLLTEAEQPRRAADAEDQAHEFLADGKMWLQVSVTPELAGNLRIDTATLRETERELTGRPSSVFSNHYRSPSLRTGHRRFIVSGDMHSGPPFQHDVAQLHSDGTGTWAQALGDLDQRSANGSDAERDGELPAYLVSDEATVEAAISGVVLLVEHARDRAQAAGQVLVRVQLINRTGRSFALGHTRGYGFPSAWSGSFAVRDLPIAEALADLDDIASSTPDLLITVHAALTDLVQSFGVAELAQLTDEGRIRTSYWNHQRQPYVQRWAEAHGVELTDEHLP